MTRIRAHHAGFLRSNRSEDIIAPGLEAGAVGRNQRCCYNLVTSIARLDGNTDGTRLAQVLDVEAILQMVSPSEDQKVDPRWGQTQPKPEPSSWR